MLVGVLVGRSFGQKTGNEDGGLGGAFSVLSFFPPLLPSCFPSSSPTPRSANLAIRATPGLSEKVGKHSGREPKLILTRGPEGCAGDKKKEEKTRADLWEHAARCAAGVSERACRTPHLRGGAPEHLAL